MTSLKVNGQLREIEADPETPLLWVLREELRLTGTKFGCGVAACGACTVHIDGEPVRSCSMPLSAVAGADIVTIEGLAASAGAADGALHPVQAAWIDIQVPQCGYCQSGMIMTTAALLKKTPNADGRRDRRGHRQSVPVRHLSAGAPRHPLPRRQGVRRAIP